MRGWLRIWDLPIPVVAQVHGQCLVDRFASEVARTPKDLMANISRSTNPNRTRSIRTAAA